MLTLSQTVYYVFYIIYLILSTQKASARLDFNPSQYVWIDRAVSIAQCCFSLK